MPRKTPASSKKITTEKKHTAVPRAIKAAIAATPSKTETAVVKAVATPVIATPAVAVHAVTTPVVAAAIAPLVTKEVPTITASAAVAEKPAAVVAVKTPSKEETMKPLIEALHNIDADVARDAATSLGQLGDAAAVEPLIEIVNNSNGFFHSVVRSAAAESLGLLKDARAFDALVHAVHDPIAEPSSEAIRALATLGDRRAVSVLIEVVRNRSGFYANSVRRSAVLGLIKLGGDEAQAELRFISADGWEDAVIREEATAAIIAG